MFVFSFTDLNLLVSFFLSVAADQAKGISIVKERSKCEGDGKVKVENVALERKVGLLSSIGLIVGIIIGRYICVRV